MKVKWFAKMIRLLASWFRNDIESRVRPYLFRVFLLELQYATPLIFLNGCNALLTCVEFTSLRAFEFSRCVRAEHTFSTRRRKYRHVRFAIRILRSSIWRLRHNWNLFQMHFSVKKRKKKDICTERERKSKKSINDLKLIFDELYKILNRM